MDDMSVTSEIHRLIDDKISAGIIVNVDWIAAEIIEIKADINGEDAPFYRVCAFRDIKRIATRAIGKYDVADTTSEQLVLPGFKHLCRAYPIARDGSPLLVPVNLCTDAELSARAEQLEEMAKGCIAHALEIREYMMARGKSAAA